MSKPMTDTAKLEALKPCPFCGSHNIDPLGWASTESAGPACDDCGASAGKATHTVEQNVTAWNTRSLSASRPAVKGLEWVEHVKGVSRAETIVGDYRVWTHHEADGVVFWQLSDGGIKASGQGTSEECFAAAQSDFEQRILSSLSPPTDDMVLVPKSALDWLNGEGPDANGHHFGGAPDDFPKGRTFWWRSKFRALIDAGRSALTKEGQ